jgi:PAS domain S-box-containing protein
MTKPTLDFETFFATSLDLLVIRDAELKIVKVNQAWEKVLGYRTEELEGQPMLSFIHPDDLAASHSQMQRVEIEKDVKGIINRYRCRDGGYRYLEWRAHQEGDLVYGVARDVTDRLAIESEMAEAKAAAETASKAKSEFLANMSHELRTPLNAILGFSEVLQSELFGPLGHARYKEYADYVHSSGAHLLDLINDVLDLSKIDSGRMELKESDFAVTDLVAEAVMMVKDKAKNHCALMVEMGTPLPVIAADKRLIKQVLLNLLSNAIKFIPDGGQVTMRAFQDAAGVALQVADTGIGMDDEELKVAFSPYGQIDSKIARQHQGTGLGLPISRALAELHGGTLTAESRKGSGTTLTLRLPASRIRHATATAEVA